MIGTCTECGAVISVPDLVGGQDAAMFRSIGLQFAQHIRTAHPAVAQQASINGQVIQPLIDGYTIMRRMTCSDVRFEKGLTAVRTAIVEVLEKSGVFDDEGLTNATKKAGEELLNDTVEIPPFPKQ